MGGEDRGEVGGNVFFDGFGKGGGGGGGGGVQTLYNAFLREFSAKELRNCKC